MIKKIKFFLKNNVWLFLSIIVILLLWQTIYTFLDITYENADILLSSPYDTFLRFFKMIVTYDYWIAIGNTLLRGIIAVSITMILGILLGMVMGFYKTVKQILIPYIKLLQAIPPISWLILAIIWLTYNTVPIFVICVALIPVMVINTIEGVENIDPKIIEMAKLYKLSRKTRFKIYIGEIFPYIFSGITIVMGQAWKISAFAEVLSNPKYGIGKELKWALNNLEVLDTIVWTLSIILISAVFNIILGLVRRRIEKWKVKR
jgi:NitT/TauT family transport system permease protein